MSNLLDKLDQSLQREHRQPAVRRENLPILIWVPFVVSVVSESQYEGGVRWRVPELEIICRVAQPISMTMLEDRVKSLLWSDRVCSPFLHGFCARSLAPRAKRWRAIAVEKLTPANTKYDSPMFLHLRMDRPGSYVRLRALSLYTDS